MDHDASSPDSDSSSEYEPGPSDTESIPETVISDQVYPADSTSIRTLKRFTYNYPDRFDRDGTLDDQDSIVNLPLDVGRHVAKPKVNLGALDKVPLEILLEILRLVDLQTLTDTRRVNKRAMQTVNALPEYKTIIKHSQTMLRIILAVEAGRFVTCREVLRVMMRRTCESCPGFGDFIYLLAMKRVCWHFFTRRSRYRPLTVSEVTHQFGLQHSSATYLPSIRSIPGEYGPSEKRCRNRVMLYDPASVRSAAKRQYGSLAAMREHVERKRTLGLEAYQDRLLQRQLQDSGPSVRRPPHLEPFDGQEVSPRRFMAVVRAAWLDPVSRTMIPGLRCKLCRSGRNRRREYYMPAFERHYNKYGKTGMNAGLVLEYHARANR